MFITLLGILLRRSQYPNVKLDAREPNGGAYCDTVLREEIVTCHTVFAEDCFAIFQLFRCFSYYIDLSSCGFGKVKI